MKKEYKRIEIHVKEATIQEKAEATIVESVCYFDKNDIIYIVKETEKVYNKKIGDELYASMNLNTYTISFRNGGYVRCVILNKEQLAELCEQKKVDGFTGLA